MISFIRFRLITGCGWIDGFAATGEKKPEDGTDEYLVLLKKKKE